MLPGVFVKDVNSELDRVTFADDTVCETTHASRLASVVELFQTSLGYDLSQVYGTTTEEGSSSLSLVSSYLPVAKLHEALVAKGLQNDE